MVKIKKMKGEESRREVYNMKHNNVIMYKLSRYYLHVLLSSVVQCAKLILLDYKYMEQYIIYI